MAITVYDQEGNIARILYQGDHNIKLSISGIGTTMPLPSVYIGTVTSEIGVPIQPTVKGGMLLIAVPDSLLAQEETLILYTRFTGIFARIPIAPRNPIIS